MEYVKQLVGLPVVTAVVFLLIRPSVLKHSAAYWKMRRHGQVDAYFASDYGQRMVRSMRIAGCLFLGYGLLQAPPISVPGSPPLAAAISAVVYVAAIPLPLRKSGQGTVASMEERPR